MMAIKAVFFDIDGTLVSFKTHAMPESTHRALHMLRRKGIKLFISSGRPLSAIDNLEGEEFDGFVTVNGSLCWMNGEIVHRAPVPVSDVTSWIEYERKNRTDCFMITSKGITMNRLTDATQAFLDMLKFPPTPILSLDRIDRNDIYQMVCLFTQDMDPHIQSLLPGCSFKRWHPSFADIVRAGSDKSSGMQAILDLTGLKREECMAFGDGGNDLEMLRFAGLSVAMGGSDDEVLAASDYVTASVDEDGIMKALQHFSII